MTAEHTIRKMKAEDLDVVMEIWLDTNMRAHNFISQSYWEDNVQSVRDMISKAEVYVWEEDIGGEIRGFIGLCGNDVGGIFVSSTAQSAGIGSALMAHVKKIRQSLTLTVYEKNKRAVRFYEHERFRIKSETVDENTKEKEFIMVWKAQGQTD